MLFPPPLPAAEEEAATTAATAEGEHPAHAVPPPLLPPKKKPFPPLSPMAAAKEEPIELAAVAPPHFMLGSVWPLLADNGKRKRRSCCGGRITTLNTATSSVELHLRLKHGGDGARVVFLIIGALGRALRLLLWLLGQAHEQPRSPPWRSRTMTTRRRGRAPRRQGHCPPSVRSACSTVLLVTTYLSATWEKTMKKWEREERRSEDEEEKREGRGKKGRVRMTCGVYMSSTIFNYVVCIADM
uniref:Uncharacterized protein n=1 Tax=Oryza glumipatula TaxID=40148 RepID=A0A0D9Y9Y0_9ORYZ